MSFISLVTFCVRLQGEEPETAYTMLEFTPRSLILCPAAQLSPFPRYPAASDLYFGWYFAMLPGDYVCIIYVINDKLGFYMQHTASTIYSVCPDPEWNRLDVAIVHFSKFTDHLCELWVDCIAASQKADRCISGSDSCFRGTQVLFYADYIHCQGQCISRRGVWPSLAQPYCTL